MAPAADQGRFDEAERYYRKAIKIREKVQGSSHPDLAMNLSNLAMLLQGK